MTINKNELTLFLHKKITAARLKIDLDEQFKNETPEMINKLAKMELPNVSDTSEQSTIAKVTTPTTQAAPSSVSNKSVTPEQFRTLVDIMLTQAGTPRRRLYEYPYRNDDSDEYVKKAENRVRESLRVLGLRVS